MNPDETLQQQLLEKLGDKYDVRIEREVFSARDHWAVHVRPRLRFVQVVSNALLNDAQPEVLSDVIANDVRYGLRKEIETLDLPLIDEVRIPRSLWFTIKMELLRLHPRADQLLEGVEQ